MWINFSHLLICLLFILITPAHTLSGSGGTETLDVSVIYRERIMLPPGSSVTVSLNDVSKMDVKATEISRARKKIATGPPYLLTLSFDPDEIIDNHRYSLKAKIENNGKLLFISTSAIDPFSSSPQPIEIITQKVAASGTDTGAAGLFNTQWQLQEASGTEIKIKEGATSPFFQLIEAENLVQGFGGCNNFRGSYRIEGNSITFSQVAATMKMCHDDMEKEQLFFSLLDGAASYELSGNELHLYDTENELIGSLKAEPSQ